MLTTANTETLNRSALTEIFTIHTVFEQQESKTGFRKLVQHVYTRKIPLHSTLQ